MVAWTEAWKIEEWSVVWLVVISGLTAHGCVRPYACLMNNWPRYFCSSYAANGRCRKSNKDFEHMRLTVWLFCGFTVRKIKVPQREQFYSFEVLQFYSCQEISKKGSTIGVPPCFTQEVRYGTCHQLPSIPKDCSGEVSPEWHLQGRDQGLGLWGRCRYSRLFRRQFELTEHVAQ